MHLPSPGSFLVVLANPVPYLVRWKQPATRRGYHSIPGQTTGCGQVCSRRLSVAQIRQCLYRPPQQALHPVRWNLTQPSRLHPAVRALQACHVPAAPSTRTTPLSTRAADRSKEPNAHCTATVSQPTAVAGSGVPVGITPSKHIASINLCPQRAAAFATARSESALWAASHLSWLPRHVSRAGPTSARPNE